MKSIIFSTILFIIFAFISCEKEVPNDTTDYDLQCENFIEINAVEYNTASSTFFYPDSISIEENCLEVTITASGCDGSTWQVELVDAGIVMESFPVQRQARIVMHNPELCLAIFQRTFTFDLQPLQASGENPIVLHVEDFDSVLYEY